MLGFILLGILIVILFAKMPIGRDNGQQDGVSESFSRLLANRIYRRGVIAQFFYVGAQIGVWSFTIRLVMQEMGWSESEASTIYLLSIIGHCLSRFIYTWLMKWIAPARLLMIGGILSTIMAFCVAFGNGTGNFLLISIILVSTFMSLMFPTIYGLALGEIAKGEYPNDSKIGASGLIMAILGGAVLTPIQGYISDNINIYYSYLLSTFCFIVVTIYAVFVTKHLEISNDNN